MTDIAEQPAMLELHRTYGKTTHTWYALEIAEGSKFTPVPGLSMSIPISLLVLRSL